MLPAHFDAFLFDLDGVIYIGDELLPGVEAVMARLREEEKAVRFLTNDPRPTREDVVDKLDHLGVEARVEEVVTSGSATAAYVREQGIETVYVLGSDGLREEMRQVGARVRNEKVDAVVVGCDVTVDYWDIAYAARHIRRGALFVATNVDASYPTPEGRAPGTGAIVSAVETAAEQEPTVVGKPYPAMFDMALRELDRERAVMFGDTPASDIAGARRAGIASVLIARTASVAIDSHRPDVTVTAVEEFFAVEA